VVYYAIVLGTNEIQLAEEVGGTGINITSAPSGIILLKESDRESWDYAYASPADILRPLRVVPDGAPDEVFPTTINTSSFPFSGVTPRVGGSQKLLSVPFTWETNKGGDRVIYTNEEDPDLCYTRSVTELSHWSPTAVNALIAEMAWRLAGALAKDPKVVAQLRGEVAGWIGVASRLDALGRSVTMPDTNGWVR
jgi:hypothetical protein